jgi:hypothetical protein
MAGMVLWSGRPRFSFVAGAAPRSQDSIAWRRSFRNDPSRGANTRSDEVNRIAVNPRIALHNNAISSKPRACTGVSARVDALKGKP